VKAEQIKKACGYVIDPCLDANCGNCKHSVKTPERISCFKHCNRAGGLKVEQLGKCRDHEKIGESKKGFKTSALLQAEHACNFRYGQSGEKTCQFCLSNVPKITKSECSKHGFEVSWSGLCVCDDYDKDDEKIEGPKKGIKMTQEQAKQAKRACNYSGVSIKAGQRRDDKREKTCENCMSIVFKVPGSECSKHGFPVAWSAVCDDWTMKEMKTESTNDIHIRAHEDNIIRHAEALSDYIARGPGRKLVDDAAYEHAWQIRRSLDHIELRRS
jgi:ribosomal protein L37E